MRFRRIVRRLMVCSVVLFVAGCRSQVEPASLSRQAAAASLEEPDDEEPTWMEDRR